MAILRLATQNGAGSRGERRLALELETTTAGILLFEYLYG